MTDTTGPATPVDLVPLCRMAIGSGEMLDVGTGPHGHRIVGEDESIAVTGERLAGEMAGRAAADWLLIGGDGVSGTVDARATIRTPDGALVFLRYQGRIALAAAPAGEPFVVSVLCETGDERYAWLNGVLGLARGLFRPGMAGLDYDVYEVRPVGSGASPGS
jgi:Protein of unknown function (DUF3237)